MDDRGDVLLIGLASDMAGDVVAPLAAAGLRPQLGAVADVTARRWSLVISAPAIPGLDSMELLAALRGATPAPPLLLVGRAAELPTAGPGPLRIECLPWPFEPQELVGRVQLLLRKHRAAVSAVASLPKRQSLPWTDEPHFLTVAAHERDELQARRRPGESFVAVLRLAELDQYRERLGRESEARLWEQVGVLAGMDALADEIIALGSEGDLLLLLPGTSAREAARRLQSLSTRLATASLQLGGQAAQFSPAIGFRGLRRSASPAQALAEARQACGQSARHLDLHPVRWRRTATAAVRRAGPLRLAWSNFYGRHLLAISTC